MQLAFLNKPELDKTGHIFNEEVTALGLQKVFTLPHYSTCSMAASRTRSAFLYMSRVWRAETAFRSTMKSVSSLENMPAKPINNICPGVIIDESMLAS